VQLLDDPLEAREVTTIKTQLPKLIARSKDINN
jgi:hypothetical protein